MQAYLKRLWAAVTLFTEESTPLLRRRPDDLEACGQGGDSDCVVVVCELARRPEAKASPFSEYQ